MNSWDSVIKINITQPKEIQKNKIGWNPQDIRNNQNGKQFVMQTDNINNKYTSGEIKITILKTKWPYPLYLQSQGSLSYQT